MQLSGHTSQDSLLPCDSLKEFYIGLCPGPPTTGKAKNFKCCREKITQQYNISSSSIRPSQFGVCTYEETFAIKMFCFATCV